MLANRSFAVAALLLIALGYSFGCNEAQRAVFGGLKSYRFPSTSMEPTIRNGDYAFAESLSDTEAPARGDIIVFRYPLQQQTLFAKRIVGVPGDKVEIRSKQLFINGVRADESYAIHTDPHTYDDPRLPEPYKSRDNFGPMTVAPAGYFVLGDNRDASSDSRYWGLVPRSLIVGRIVKTGPVDGPLRAVKPGAGTETAEGGGGG